jgi:RNase P protein component
LNMKLNKKDFNRFAIVIWSKSVNTNVTRSFFRRFFYNFIHNSSFFTNNVNSEKNYDLVFIVKKQTKLDKSDKKTIVDFEKDLSFLENKIKK